VEITEERCHGKLQHLSGKGLKSLNKVLIVIKAEVSDQVFAHNVAQSILKLD
jgi:hypothetical protein